MTRSYLSRWMADRTFYHLELARYANKDGHTPDNPDQRLQEDMQIFTDSTMTLSMGLLNAVVTLAELHRPALGAVGQFLVHAVQRHHLPDRRRDGLARHWVIPSVGTVVTHFIGRPLIGLNFKQQRFEADFRHHLVRVREYSEAIALDHGEKVERGQLDLRFGDVLRNYLLLIKQQKNLVTFTSFFGQAAVIFPFLVAAAAVLWRRVPARPPDADRLGLRQGAGVARAGSSTTTTAWPSGAPPPTVSPASTTA